MRLPLSPTNIGLSKLIAGLACTVLVVACAAAPAEDDVTALPSSGLAPQAQGGSGGNGQARYIVKFRNPAARGAVQAAGGAIALELPGNDAFAAYMPAAAVFGLSHNPNIEYIEEDVLRAPSGEVVPYGIDMVQARQIWDSAPQDGTVDPGANTGSAPGAKICIIDSGVDATHPDFAGMGSRLSGVNDSGSGSWGIDRCGHGTHVAGTIAANNNADGVVGVAPGASLFIVKVFGADTTPAGADACRWAYSSTLVNALSKCQAGGATIVSMSLGGGAKSRTEETAFKNAAAAGVLSIAAAGNDGNTALSYPASYPSVISVAAIDDTKKLASFSQRNSEVEIAAPGVNTLSTVPVGTGRAAATTVQGTAYASNGMDGSPLRSANGELVNCGLGDSPCAAAAGGKVCLIARGTIDFATKINNCSAGGGAGAILYNNVAGLFGGDAGTTTTIPAVSISQADGQLLLASALGGAASIALTATNHGFKSGTSMATPHVSGVAALVWTAHPEWPAAKVRTALGATAEDLGTAGRDNSYGFGLVRTANAIAYTPPVCSLKLAGASCASNSECCSNSCSKRTKKCD